MTYYLNPQMQKAHLLVVCTNTQEHGHSGLGVNTLHTVRVLRRNKVRTDPLATTSFKVLDQHLVQNKSITHCIIEAPWVDTANMKALTGKHPDIHFVVRIHSQIGFLQAEAGALRIVREQLNLQEDRHNFSVASNSEKLANFIRQVYSADCLFLPNLYSFERAHRRHRECHDHRILRIGSFGAVRLLKNHLSSAAAALQIAQMRNSDVEFYISSGREEHGKGVVHAILQLFKDVPYAKFIQLPWLDWPEFRRKVAHMDLCMQPSMTETFNLVTADAAAEGVPSVVSPAIEWCPKDWQADIDSVEDIAQTGSKILSDRFASERGLAALSLYSERAIHRWLHWLGGQPHESH